LKIIPPVIQAIIASLCVAAFILLVTDVLFIIVTKSQVDFGIASLVCLAVGAIVFGLLMRNHTYMRWYGNPKITNNLIIPKLQVTPSDILDDNIATTAMIIYVLNCSDYVAKNISVDMKFGDSLWKNDLRKAASIDSHNKLFSKINDPLIAEILSKTSEQQAKEMLKNYLKRPILDELKPGIKYKIVIIDENKDWALKQELFFVSGGKTTPIKPEESPFYQESQGWKEQIDNTRSGEPIKILLRTVWENEIRETFDQIVEYQLICTKIGTGRSYKFLPTGNVIKN